MNTRGKKENIKPKSDAVSRKLTRKRRVGDVMNNENAVFSKTVFDPAVKDIQQFQNHENHAQVLKKGILSENNAGNVNVTSKVSKRKNNTATLQKPEDQIKKKPVWGENSSIVKDTTGVKLQKDEDSKKVTVLENVKKSNTRNAARKPKQMLLENVKCKSKVPENIFGFNSEESDEECASYVESLTKFDPTKPYRLALYVHPSKRPRIDPEVLKKCQAAYPAFNTTNNISNISANITALRSSSSHASMKPPAKVAETFKVPFTSTPKRNCSNLTNVTSPIPSNFKVPLASTPMEKKPKKLVQPKISAVFPPCPKRTRAVNLEKKYTSFFETSDDSLGENGDVMIVQVMNEDKEKTSSSSSEDNQPTFIDEDSSTENKFAKTNRRRSYVKKTQRIKEVESELSSDEIMKSLEKTRKKTKKTKKNAKEEEEFEKWSRSINSEFDEVEKFDISFT